MITSGRPFGSDQNLIPFGYSGIFRSKAFITEFSRVLGHP